MKKERGQLFYESWALANAVRPVWGTLSNNQKGYYIRAEDHFLAEYGPPEPEDEQSNECPIPTLQEGP